MQKNYPFFETKLPKANHGIFQKNDVHENRAFSKIVLQRFFALFFLIMANSGYSQLATEFFESGIPGTWAVGTNLVTAPTNNWSATPTGGYLATGGTFVNPSLNTTTGTTAEYYMISPQFLTPANGEIRFWTKQGSFTNRGTTYQVRISTRNQPDIDGFNVILASWTETQLNIAATTYEEKIVPLGSIGFPLPANIPVYIAFVAITNQTGTTATAGDTWFVDNARVITSCPPVTGITSVVSADGATINWTHPTATNFGVEVVAAGAGHGATGTPVTGTSYTTPSTLTPNTTYDVYIRTNCDSSTSSNWAGPFHFTTSMVGLTCPSAITVPPDVTTTPYVLSSNLDQYYDGTTYVDMDSQGLSCQPIGQDMNLLSGNHAYLSYTPATSGLITITQAVNTSGGVNNCYNALSSVFIFDGCAGVGTSAACVGGMATTSSTPVQIPNFYAQAGHTYIFVISSPYQHSNPGAGICFTFTISGSICPSPTQPSMVVDNLQQTTATASWDNVQNLVSAWQYLVLPTAASAPTGSQSGTSTNTNVNNPVSGLTAGFSYNLYVRSMCATPGAWSAARTFTTQCNVQPLPYYTGFTNSNSANGIEEPCWTSLNLNNDASFFHYGPNAFSEPVAKLRTGNAGNATNDMLVTPKFHLDGVTQKRLRFRYNIYGNWGLIVDNPTGGPGSFEVKLSTTGVGAQNFTTTVIPLASYTTAYNFIEAIVPLPNITGDINIAWILPPGALQTGTWLYIDDVYVEDLPACSEPAYPVVTPGSLTSTSVEVSWTNGYQNTQWQLVAQPVGAGVPTATPAPGSVWNIVSDNPYTITGLTPSTQYEFYMRAYCNTADQSIWVGPIDFDTVCIAQPTPYYESLDNGDLTSKKFCWTTNNANNDPAGWRINNTEASIYPQPINFFEPFVSYDDWLISVPVNAVGAKRLRFDYRAATSLFYPTPRANYEVLMSSTPDFATYTTLIPSHDLTNTAYQQDTVLFTGTGITYIAFRVPPSMVNPGDSGILMIDNVIIDDAPPCPDPTHLAAANITSTAANLSWTAGLAETQWQIMVQPAGTGTPTGSGTTVNTTPAYNATPLTPDMAYEFYVRAVCTSENSAWVGPYAFRTTCNPLPTPFLETFDSNTTTETCWTIVNGNGDGNRWNLNQPANPIFGDQMAALFTGSNGDNNDWLITPTLMAHAGQRLRFYYKTYNSAFEEDLKVMLSVNGVATNQFSTILYENNYTTTIDAAGTTLGSNTITVANGAGVRVGDTFYIPDFPIPYATTVTAVNGAVITVSAAATITMAGPLHIVFTHEVINNTVAREMVIDLTGITTPTNINIGFHTPFFPPNPWNYRGQYTFIDNVIVEDIPACPSVINVTTSDILDVSAVVNWGTTGTETSWEVSVQPYGTPAPVGNTLPAYLHTATSHPYTVTGLTPSSLYQYYVRAVCSGSSQSTWVGPFEILTRCDNTNMCLYTISVSNGNTGTVTDNVSLIQNGVEVQAIEFPGFGQPPVLDYQVFLCTGVAFSLYWNGFGSGVQYAEAQIVVRDESNTIVWTSPLGLGLVNTTLFSSVASCGVVTCSQPTNLTVNNQGVFSWTPGGSETQWEVFVQPYGNGTIPQSGTIVNTPFYTPVPADFADPTATTYEYLVRAVCGPSDTSYWTGPRVFIRNDEPTNAVRLQVNAGQTCELSGVDASFISATASTVPTSCAGGNGGDIWYDFVAASKVHTIELSDFGPGSYYDSAYVGAWPQIMMSLYEVQPDGSLVEKGCSNNNSFVAKYASELVVGNTYKIRLTLNDPLTTDKTFHICITTPEDICDMDAFNYDFEKLPMQSVSGISTIINHRVTPGWRVNTDWGTMFFLEGNNIGLTPYSGGQCIQLTQDDQSEWNPSDPNIKGLYKDFDTSEITMMDYSFASATRSNSSTVQLFAGPPSGPFTLVVEDFANTLTWDLIQGSYIIPPGQANTRFIFRVKEYGLGHILDAANFKANVDITVNTTDTTLDCTTTSMNLDANGVGQWVADSNNPGTVTIANPASGLTNVTGFTSPGAYTFYWNTRYCQKSIIITKQGTTSVPTVTTPVTYCVGAVASPLMATPPSGETLLWYTMPIGGNGSGTATAPTPVTTTAGTTSYYVSTVDSNGCEGVRTEIVVQVNALPTAAIAGATTICQGSTTAITFNGTANATVTYTVNSGTGQNITLDANGTATLTTPALTANATYDLVSVSSTGTAPCSQSQTGSVLVTVEALPTATISGTTTVCLNAACTNVTFTGADGIAPYTFTYTIDGGSAQTITSTGNTATVCVPTSAAGVFIYELVTVSGAGVASCTQTVTGSATVTVSQLTTPNVTFSYNQTCSNAGTNPLPVLTPNFAPGGVYSSSTLTVDPTTGAVTLPAPIGSHQIIYTLVANPATCTAGGTFTATLAIVSNITPVTGFSYDVTYCANAGNTTPQLSAGFTTGGVFTANGGLTINPATGEISIGQNNPGTYVITYTVAADAAACNPGGSTVFTITIISDVSFVIDDFCQESNLTLQLIDTNFDTGTASYTWSQGGSTIGTNATLNVEEYLTQNPSLNLPLIFTVTVNSDGCSNGQNFTVDNNPCQIIPRGISPNNDDLNDTFDLTGYGVKDISIFNRYGTKVYSFSGNYTNQWKGQTDSGQELPDGTYFYSIHTNEGATRTGWVYINREY
jgi:gliding motility-associated-like protein